MQRFPYTVPEEPRKKGARQQQIELLKSAYTCCERKKRSSRIPQRLFALRVKTTVTRNGNCTRCGSTHNEDSHLVYRMPEYRLVRLPAGDSRTADGRLSGRSQRPLGLSGG